MTPEEWREAKALFDAALAREPSERALFLAQNCANLGLRHEVERLLSNFEEAGEFLSSPVLQPDIARPASIRKFVRKTKASHR